jgi:Pyridoxamine 5'-phosphate oxidase
MGDPKPSAPSMPASYGVPTDASGATRNPWSSAVDKLQHARNYWLCTTRGDGRPHAAPVWAVWFEDALWFSTDPTSLKARNLARDARASVHLENGDEVVIVDGEAERATWPSAVVDEYESKYGYRIDTSNENYGLYILRPRSALTWDELKNAVRWAFD